jgi:hypothetical protein
MNPTHGYDDLTGRLQELFLLPPEERKGAAIKADLYTRLLYQPVSERNLLLADIANTQGIEYEQAAQEFTTFEENVKAERIKKPYRPSPNPKRFTGPINENPTPDSPLTTSLADVESKPVDWLWKNFIPIGCGVILTGDPGAAKTWFALDIAARLSRGTRWVDGTPVGAPGGTIILSVEDDASYTLRPRFDGLGGDPALIAVYNAVQPVHLDLSQPGGLERLENDILRRGNIKLVIIDPIIDFSGRVNPN